MTKACEEAEQPQYDDLTDEDVEHEAMLAMARLLEHYPELAIAAAAAQGWTIIPPDEQADQEGVFNRLIPGKVGAEVTRSI